MKGPGLVLSGDGGDEALAAKPEFPDDDPVFRRAEQTRNRRCSAMRGAQARATGPWNLDGRAGNTR